jgi:hypothetical protein
VGRKRTRIPIPRAVESRLDSVLDKALAVQRPVVLGYLDRVRRSDPQPTPAEAVQRLEEQYRTTVIGIGGAAGAAAAVPGVGTAASIASGVAEVTAFVSASAMFVLALAELHGIPVSDPEVRRALVLSVLVGEGGAAALEGLAAGEKHWAKVFARTAGAGRREGKAGDRIGDALGGVNGQLARLLLRRFGARQGALLAGRALPLGIGAAIGAGGNAALARGAINSARKAFGPAPDRFPPRVVDVASPAAG